MNMKLSFFCEDTGYSKKDSPVWTDVCDALHQLRTNTGSINIEDVVNQKTLSIHSDGKRFLLSLIDGKDDETKIKSIQSACFKRKISFASPVSWNSPRDLTGDFDFVADVSRTFFTTGQV